MSHGLPGWQSMCTPCVSFATRIRRRDHVGSVSEMGKSCVRLRKMPFDPAFDVDFQSCVRYYSVLTDF
uniref:Uncharacterized protein n=1 Tax=Tanacetum cinerariifolium TaxID=118510 RepID=A0A6L2JJJ5_TANCI|nr:hypothetical protein [Tanacetum cinerariifolium]